MFFLLRCLICIGLVYAMASSDRALPTPASIGVSGSHAAALPHAMAHPPRLAETTKAIVKEGVDTLGAAARSLSDRAAGMHGDLEQTEWPPRALMHNRKLCRIVKKKIWRVERLRSHSGRAHRAGFSESVRKIFGGREV